MVRGDLLIESFWSRDFSSLWQGLRRLMVPMYLQNNRIAFGIFFAVLFLLFMTFPIMIYSIFFFQMTNSFLLLLIGALSASILIYLAAIVEVRILHLNFSNIILFPAGGFIVAFGFLNGILSAMSDNAITWKGRNYSMKEHIQNSIQV